LKNYISIGFILRSVVSPFLLNNLNLILVQVSALVGELASKLVQQPVPSDRPELRREPSSIWQPPKQKVP
jgi:hypothetical protein